MPSTSINKRRPLQRKSIPNGKIDSVASVREDDEDVTEAMIQVIKNLRKKTVDESQAKIVHGGEPVDVRPSNGGKVVVEISSDDEVDERDDNEDGEEADSQVAEEDSKSASQSSGSEPDDAKTDRSHSSAHHVLMRDALSPRVISADEVDEHVEEPTFGELIRGNHTESIHVEAAFEDSRPRPLIPTDGAKHLQPPPSMSLGTVLTQSLKTNDINLLESCLHTTDLNTIRSTIERLDSPLAAVLLEKLAERLHRRPGRAGSLMVWVQWTLVSHGGYLAAQPALMKKMSSLNRVIKERAGGLQPLLSLKGKLDMLEAQMQLRRSMQASAGAANQGNRALTNDEERVVYVEGQDQSDSDNDVSTLAIETSSAARSKRKRTHQTAEEEESDSDDDRSDMPTTVNGIDHESDDGNESSYDEDGIIDDQAEETDASSDAISDDDIDHEDIDSVDEGESDDAGPSVKRPAVMKRNSGLFSRGR